jgi:thiol-disulfide isomerase/thioredoxin
VIPAVVASRDPAKWWKPLGRSVSAAFADDGSRPCESGPYVVKIHAEWCGTCEAIAPTRERHRVEVGDRATLVTLDVTDRAAFEASRATAEELGVADVFLEYRGRGEKSCVLGTSDTYRFRQLSIG